MFNAEKPIGSYDAVVLIQAASHGAGSEQRQERVWHQLQGTCGAQLFPAGSRMNFGLTLLRSSVISLCFFAGCGDGVQNSAPIPLENTTSATLVPQTGPVVTASPNPVPAGTGSAGTTVIAWNTGGGDGEVYLSTNGTEETLFARGTQGAQTAPWIGVGTTYDFRLYSAGDRSKMLGNVKVTRNR